MKFTLSSRQLDTALRIAGVLVVIALVYLAYTVWDVQRTVERGKVSNRAIDALVAAVNEHPRDPSARVLLGQALFAAGRSNDAVEQFQAALKLDENNVGALEGLALIALQREEWRTAEGYWRRIITELTSGQFAGVDERLERAYHYLGVTLIQLQDYEEAVRYLKEALRIRRGASDTHYALALAYKGLGSKDNQRKELEAALAYDPLMPEANYEMGLLLKAEGDDAGAAELFRRSVDGAPGRREPLRELTAYGPFEERLARARSLVATDKAQALVEARIAVALEPRNLEALRLMAQLLDDIGSPKDAKAAWERLLQYAPGDAEASAALKRLAGEQ